MVQRRAARWVLNRHHNISSVTDMVNKFGWRILEQYRYEARMLMMFKMVHGLQLVAVNPYQYVQPVNRITRHAHAYGFI